jgi:virulence activator alpha
VRRAGVAAGTTRSPPPVASGWTRGSSSRSRVRPSSATSACSEPAQVVELAREQLAAHRAKLAVYEELVRRYTDRPRYAERLVSVGLGVRLSQAAAEFWDEVQSAASASASTDSGDWAASMTAILPGSAAASAS